MALTGCADNEEALIVLHAAAWEAAGECRVDAGNDNTLPRGIADVSLGTGYLAPLVLLNQLPSQPAATNNSGIDNAEVQLRSVEVDLSMPQAPQVIDAVEAQNEAFVSFEQVLASDSLSPGARHGTLVEVITSPAAAALSGAIEDAFPDQPDVRLVLEAKIVFRGLQTGNTVGNLSDVEAREYIFPIEVCNECLIDCSSCMMGSCPTSIDDVVGGICGNIQDFPAVPAQCGVEDEGN